MTGPAGGGGFIEGDDYVALRLNLDIPTEAVNGVQTITKEVEKYQVAMEAAIRAEADMASYADKMAESIKKASEAQDTMTEQLKTYLQLSGKITAQGHGQSSGVPQGPHQQPWEPGTAGTGAAPVPPGARMPNPSDVVYQLGDRAGKTHADAASYLNMQHQRGGVPDTISISPESIKSLANQIADRETALNKQADHTKHPGSAPQRPSHPSSRHPSPTDPFDQFQQRVESFGGLANQVMNEIGGGGGMGHMALQGLNYARKKLEERAAKTDADSSGGDNEGSGNPDSDTSKKGMGGLAKTLGIGGGIAAAALAAFGLVEKGGQMVQGWRNIASTRGGGAGEGFQLEMKQRVMAMDPMLTTEQTREIMQATLSEGYADASGNGPQAAEITNYLKNNIKNYNMSVTESMELLKLTAHTTKVSVTELNGALYTLQQMSKGGSQSQQELQRQFRERWGQLESQGVDEKAAMASALQSTGVFFDNPQLAGSFSSTTFSDAMGAEEGVFGGPGGTPMTDMPGGLLPGNYGVFNENVGRGNEAQLNVLQHYADSAKAAGPDTSGGKGDLKTNTGWLNATYIFHRNIQHLLSGNSPYRSRTMANRLYNQLAWGMDMNGKPLPKDPKEIIAKANEETQRVVKHPGHGVTGFTIPGIGAFPFGGEGIVPDTYTSGPEDRVINAFGGANKIEVKGPNGKWEDLDPTNQQQAEGVAHDKYKWRRKGVDTGEGILLSETPGDITGDFRTDDPTNPAGLGSSDKSSDSKNEVTGTLTIKIDKDGNVSAPSSVPLTANNDAANKGAGDAQVNNPPIGDAILDWGKHIFTGGKGSFF